MIKRLLQFVVVLGCTLALGACGGKGAVETVESDSVGASESAAATVAEETVADSQPVGVVFRDDLDRELTLDAAMVTAAFSGSLADAWILAGGELAATTEDAPDVLTLPEGTPLVGSLKSPNLEALVDLGVEAVLLNAKVSEHVDLLPALEDAGITPVYFTVEDFEDYENMMVRLTTWTGREDMYAQNVEAVAEQIEAQKARIQGEAPRILFLRAFSTGVKAKGSDSTAGAMLKDLGCVNIADEDGSLLDDLSVEAIVEADPEYIFVTTMGESEEKAMAQVEELLTSHQAWAGLTAVQEGRYYVLPKALFHLKPNSRWGESYTILADYLYGEE